MHEVWVAVVLFAVGKGELRGLNDCVDVVGAVVAQVFKIISFEDRQLLQKHWPLAPGATFVDVITTVIERDWFLDFAAKARQIFDGQKPAMSLRMGGDDLGNFSAVEGLTRGG